MADMITLGSVGKIIEVAVKIKEAVKTVKQNERECRGIQRLAAIVEAQLKRLEQMTEAMEEEANNAAMQDLAESLESALELVNKCQKKHVLLRCLGGGGMAQDLHRARMDIHSKLQVGTFVNTIQDSIMLTNILQSAAAAAGGGGPPPPPPNKVINAGFTRFSFSELKAATNDFSDQSIIGQGGFSTVYKGFLDDGRVVSIKKFSVDPSTYDETRVLGEIDFLSKVDEHKNILRHLGYCTQVKEESSSHEGTQHSNVAIGSSVVYYYLVAEFMPNGTMNDIITQKGRGRPTTDDWFSGFRMIQGIAEGLHYLHEKRVVHMDLKPSNILLDSDMNPRIADFGLATTLQRGHDKIRNTESVAGTVGYMAPEYMAYGKISLKCDVYAFGVIITKIINRFWPAVPADVGAFQKLARKNWEGGQLDLFDPRLGRCILAGLLCLELDHNDRPTMADVLLLLNSDEQSATTLTEKLIKKGRLQVMVTAKDDLPRPRLIQSYR